jgi:hypothetical protein
LRKLDFDWLSGVWGGPSDYGAAADRDEIGRCHSGNLVAASARVVNYGDIHRRDCREMDFPGLVSWTKETQGGQYDCQREANVENRSVDRVHMVGFPSNGQI